LKFLIKNRIFSAVEFLNSGYPKSQFESPTGPTLTRSMVEGREKTHDFEGGLDRRFFS
jgi:hypothetical protein